MGSVSRRGVLLLALPLTLGLHQRARAEARPEAAGERARPPVSQFFLGEDWGCAQISTSEGPSWHCWQAATGDKVRAWQVPWMDGYPSIQGGRDRVCIASDGGLHCWGRPRSFIPGPRDHLDFDAWARRDRDGSRRVTWPNLGWSRTLPSSGQLRQHPLATAVVGGTFACFVSGERPQDAARACHESQDEGDAGWRCRWNDGFFAADPHEHCTDSDSARRCWRESERDVWCLGDDELGQRGGRRQVPVTLETIPELRAREKGKDRRVAWIGPAFAELAAGMWHGCGTTVAGEIHCWGRDDFGQLGVPAPETCPAGESTVGCARTPRRLPFQLPHPTSLRGGDLFTCASGPERRGLLCWGANRHGFFGSRAECDARLSKRWPTARGTVVASRASCSKLPTPVLADLTIDQLAHPLPHETAGTLDFDVGPGGVCAVHGGRVTCAGAIPSPGVANLSRVRVSPGERANACALGPQGDVVCWGEGYSRGPGGRGGTRTTARVAITPPPPNSDASAKRFGSSTGPSCSLHRPCFQKRTLPGCAPSLRRQAVPSWSELAPSAAQHQGRRVRVQGFLATGGGAQTAVGCSEGDCCNSLSASLVVTDQATDKDRPAGAVVLDKHSCLGDESRVCCDLALGQKVVATGNLQADESPSSQEPRWRLSNVELCRVGR